MATVAKTVLIGRLKPRSDWPMASWISARQFATETGGGGDNDDDRSTAKKVPLYKRIFGFGKRQEEVEFEAEQEGKFRMEEKMLQAMESEEKQDKLLRKQNKSRLHFSDRQMLRGLPPNVGLYMEWCERHITKEYKANLLGRFGRSNTGIDPSVSWPTPEEMQLQKEYEHVLYNGMTLREMIGAERNKIVSEREAIRLKEKEIDENLAKMDVELEAWKTRISSRREAAEKERREREQMFYELRQEFGYDINPEDPQFAEKIAEKEKELSKKNKDEKKKVRAEKAAQKANRAAEFAKKLAEEAVS